MVATAGLNCKPNLPHAILSRQALRTDVHHHHQQQPVDQQGAAGYYKGQAENGFLSRRSSPFFADRIADTGVDPRPIRRESRKILAGQPKAELLWTSVREVPNIVQAEQSGGHIVTVQHDILAKAAKLLSMDLAALSLDTVKMFANDAASAG